MYDVHTTEGIVLESIPVGEANKRVIVFTKDFGMVHAVAQGIRFQKSKLRFRLVDYSVVSLSLVKGKGQWRLTNVLDYDNAFGLFQKDGGILEFRARIASLLKRLVRGEDADSELFTIVTQSFRDMVELAQEQRALLEILTVLRILYRLGYIGEKDIVSKYCGAVLNDAAILAQVADEQKRLIRAINTSLTESQL